MNIVLTGFMGTGKTSVGKVLAQRLGWSFCDTDELIEKDAGMAIADIFQKKGEPFFRDLEHEIIRLVALKDRWIIATGGGVPLRVENIDELERNGMVFCLSARPDTILSRVVSQGGGRPLLNVPDPRKTVEGFLKQRELFYKRCHAMIETDALSPEQVADKIIEFTEKP